MITIFTPTYNRAEKLERLYNSLMRQERNSFEWLVVDDGSTDNTQTVVEGFDTSLFPIRYYKKENGGKHTAYNYALQLSKGKWICGFSDGMLEQVELWCNGLPRKILGYRTPEEVFDEQLDRIYADTGVA